ncbi:MAG: SipW-dependent-type signal peptide-containing protein [Oscillospiraceae bacterium]|nr:SipW-dependent-type signal peptide-containing protein [Oscillospiraceae bacterium]
MKNERITVANTISKKKGMPAGKLLVLVLALLVTAGVVGGTLAYFTDDDEVNKTVTVGSVDITLTETEAEFVMVPGVPVNKDPSVTVAADSSDCWVFALLQPSADFEEYVTFNPNTDAWTQMPTGNGSTLLYIKADTAAEKGVPFSLLKGGSLTDSGITYSWADNQVLVYPWVSNEMMQAVGRGDCVLQITAYAIQTVGFDTPEAAWAELQGET